MGDGRAPGDTFGLHHHTNDYVLYITGGANLRVDDKDSGAYDFIGHERSVFLHQGGRDRELPQRQLDAVS